MNEIIERLAEIRASVLVNLDAYEWLERSAVAWVQWGTTTQHRQWEHDGRTIWHSLASMEGVPE